MSDYLYFLQQGGKRVLRQNGSFFAVVIAGEVRQVSATFLECDSKFRSLERRVTV